MGPTMLSPHYAEFIIGPAEGRTRWLHAGYPPSRCSNRLINRTTGHSNAR
jgi:hypothetical protein